MPKWIVRIIATVVIFCSVAVVSTTAAPADSANVTVANPADGGKSSHNWNMSVGSGASGIIDEIRLNYTGTGADLSEATLSTVKIDNSEVKYRLSSSGDYLNITLVNNKDLSKVNNITVKGKNITNPSDPTADPFNPNMSLVNTSGSETILNTTNASFNIRSGGYLNGTVLNRSGATLTGVKVGFYNLSAQPRRLGSDVTDANGNYSFRGVAGRYGVVIIDPNYSLAYKSGLEIRSGTSKTADLVTTELGGDGTIKVTVEGPNGNALQGATVRAEAVSFPESKSATTNAAGDATVTVTAGTYELEITHPDYPTKTIQDVSVSEAQTTTKIISFKQPSFLNGTISGTGKRRAFVITQKNNQFYVNRTDSNGNYNLTVPPGTYTLSVFYPSKSAPPREVSVDAGNVTTTDFSLLDIKIKHESFKVIKDPGNDVKTNKIAVDASAFAGPLKIRLDNMSEGEGFAPSGIGPPDDLEGLGVDRGTRFRINVTVTNYSADALMWGVRDATWSSSENATVANGTDITIRGNPVNMQVATGENYEYGPVTGGEVDWSSGIDSGADVGKNRTIYFAALNLSLMPDRIRQNIDGMSLTTNAQVFSLPSASNNSIGARVAAPSSTVEGNDHTGFYQVTIPDSQLNEWGVDNPETELTVETKRGQRDYSVENVSNGARVTVKNISYTKNQITISPNPVSNRGERTDGAGGDSTPGTEQFTNGQARVSFGTGADVRSVEVISPGTTGRLQVQRLGTSFENVPDPQTIAIKGMDITAPHPSSGTATVQITLSDDFLSQHTIPVDQLTIQRYDAESGTWEILETTTTEVDRGVLFEAETDEFSVFAVARTPSGKETTTPTATPTPTQTGPRTTTPATTSAGTTTPSPTPADTSGPAPTTAAGVQTTTTPTTTDSSGEGFTAVTVFVALIATMLLLRRRS